MNLSKVLVSFVAVFALFAVTASAIEIDMNATPSHFQVSVKGIDITESEVVSAFAGETIPIKVVFRAEEDADRVRVKAWISGHRSDITASTERFNVVGDKWYSNLLSLTLPEDVDPVDSLVLVVRIEDKLSGEEQEFLLNVQRESFSVDLISVETGATVMAGENLEVDLVAKNRGSEELEDLFVLVRVPTLGIEKKVFFGDLDATDFDVAFFEGQLLVIDDDNEDAAQRIVSLKIPENAKPGVYTLEITAYTADVTEKTTRNFVVLESEVGSDVMTAITSKEASVGQEVVFDLILVNQGSRNRVYELLPEVSGSLTVNVDEPIVSVPGDSSKVVKVRVVPGKEGTYTFGINVNSEGQLVERVGLTVNAGGQAAVQDSIVVLTVVLAIIFVVLLVVLIVLLTRKPSKEVEESYY